MNENEAVCGDSALNNTNNVIERAVELIPLTVAEKTYMSTKLINGLIINNFSIFNI